MTIEDALAIASAINSQTRWRAYVDPAYKNRSYIGPALITDAPEGTIGWFGGNLGIKREAMPQKKKSSPVGTYYFG